MSKGAFQGPVSGTLLLLALQNSEELLKVFHAAGYEVVAPELAGASTHALAVKDLPLHNLRTILAMVDVVVLDVTTSSHEVLTTIRKLRSVIGVCSLRPRLLCFATVHRSPQFILKVQNAGARYVRLGNNGMLLEAIEVLVTEINGLEKDGPNFVVVHKLSQGTCAPGEEVFAVMLKERDHLLHLPLALAERLVFEVLAQHPNVALDSLQIASQIGGDWFFRDHGLNRGWRQLTRIKRASVKVRVQRIRAAMASCFIEAHLGFDPYEILRSCPTSTNKVLYRLNGHVEWHHPIGGI